MSQKQVVNRMLGDQIIGPLTANRVNILDCLGQGPCWATLNHFSTLWPKNLVSQHSPRNSGNICFLGHSVLAGNDRRKLYFPLLLDEKDGKDYISNISYIIYV